MVEVIARSATDSEQDVANNAAQIAHWLAVLAQPTLVLDILLPGIGGFSTGNGVRKAIIVLVNALHPHTILKVLVFSLRSEECIRVENFFQNFTIV